MGRLWLVQKSKGDKQESGDLMLSKMTGTISSAIRRQPELPVKDLTGLSDAQILRRCGHLMRDRTLSLQTQLEAFTFLFVISKRSREKDIEERLCLEGYFKDSLAVLAAIPKASEHYLYGVAGVQWWMGVLAHFLEIHPEHTDWGWFAESDAVWLCISFILTPHPAGPRSHHFGISSVNTELSMHRPDDNYSPTENQTAKMFIECFKVLALKNSQCRRCVHRGVNIALRENPNPAWVDSADEQEIMSLLDNLLRVSEASPADPQICVFPSCENQTMAGGEPLLACSRCKTALYCSVDCQRK